MSTERARPAPQSGGVAWGPLLALFLVLGAGADPVQGQIPDDRFHLSVSLGGYVMFGIGFTHWVERHHAVEATLFPLGFPWEGFPCAVRAGYAWTPSDEVWRAKLGGNLTLLLHEHGDGGTRVTPLLVFTPGLQYNPSQDVSIRWDMWMSYYLREKVFAPTALEVMLSGKD